MFVFYFDDDLSAKFEIDTPNFFEDSLVFSLYHNCI